MRPLAPAVKIGLFALILVGGLAVSGGGGTVGSFTDTATSEGNSISARSWTTELDARFAPETLGIDDNGTTTIHLETSAAGSDVDPASIEVRLEHTGIEAPLATCNPTKCLFKPEAQAVVNAVDGEPGKYKLRMTGKIEDGTPFEATTQITVAEST